MVKFLSSKRGITPKQNWIRISCGYAQLHIKSFIITKFHEILLSNFRGVALTNSFRSIFHFGQISKFKKGVFREKNGIKISCESTHVLHNYKVSLNSVERFQRSCADKKNRTDGLTDLLTDWLRDGSKTFIYTWPPQLDAWGITNYYIMFYREYFKSFTLKPLVTFIALIFFVLRPWIINNLQDWKYTSFVVFIPYSQNMQRHYAAGGYYIIADVVERIGLKFQFQSWFSIHSVFLQLSK